MPWGLRVPIWKMNLCSKFLRLSVVPWCRERPQIDVCSLKWLGRLKCRAIGFDAFLSFFSTWSKSKWTPPEGQFASLDFFIKKCRHDIQKLKFNCHTKFSNLSSEEWLALKNLSKRHDIVIKSVDKGGALVVWRSDLYEEEALRQLSDTSVLCQSRKRSYC